MSSSVHRGGVATSRPPQELTPHNGLALGQPQVLKGVPNSRAAGEDTRSEKPLLEGRRGVGEGSIDTQSSPMLQAQGTATVWQVGAQRCQVLCAAFQMEQFLKLFFEPISHQANRENWLVELQGHVALLFQSSANKLKLQSWMPWTHQSVVTGSTLCSGHMNGSNE